MFSVDLDQKGLAVESMSKLAMRFGLLYLDRTRKAWYNHNRYGPVKVSTGILPYDKRGGLSNPVNCST